MVIHPEPTVSNVTGSLNIQRLVLSGTLALLLLGRGPIYKYTGSPEDEAKLSARYGPPDGGPFARGPDLFALPEGWILAGACLILAVSAMPFAPAGLRHLPSGPLGVATGLLMLIAARLTDPRTWLHRDLGVGGTFGWPDAVKYAYEFYALIVLAVGAWRVALARRPSLRPITGAMVRWPQGSLKGRAALQTLLDERDGDRGRGS